MAEIEYGGIKVGGSKLLLILPLIGTLGGGLWAGFEFYKDYMDMKGDLISNEDIATIYPIFSILEDYDKLIDILSILSAFIFDPWSTSFIFLFKT